MLKEKTIQLETPLKLGDVEVKEITLKEPTAGQMVQVQNYSGFEQTMKLIAAVSGVQPLVVGTMGMRDFKKCADFLDDIFLAIQPDA